MTDTRLRSEYRLALTEAMSATFADDAPALDATTIRPVERRDREALATVILDAYHGTIDDEGEGSHEASAAIHEYFATMVWPHGRIVERDGTILAFSLVVVVGGLHYIDPVATAVSLKGHGLGTAAVKASLRSLLEAGITEVGAVITNGNTPSERLFTALGFVRIGPWQREHTSS